MCTLIVLYKTSKDYPVIAMENRDEIYSRNEIAPQKMTGEKNNFYCARDSLTDGTWFGLNEKGLFAGLTNRHSVSRKEVKAESSRGLLCSDVLGKCSSSEEGADYLFREFEERSYRSVNFVLADKKNCYYIEFDGDIKVKEIEAGKHVFTNYRFSDAPRDKDDLDSFTDSLLRKKRAKKLIEDLKTEDIEQTLPELKKISADHCPGLSTDFTICMHGKGPNKDFVTMSSSIVALGKETKYLYCPGNPCMNEFGDYSYIAKEVCV